MSYDEFLVIRKKLALECKDLAKALKFTEYEKKSKELFLLQEYFFNQYKK